MKRSTGIERRTERRAEDERRVEDRRRKFEPHEGVERRHCDDRRHDMPSRERIEWLEVRYRRVTELLFASMVTTLIVTTLGLVFYGKQAGEIQSSRLRATQVACEQRNGEHTALVNFVAGAAPDLRQQALKSFPTEPDCERYAQRLVKTP